MNATRTINIYDPIIDLGRRHPEWTVLISRLHGIGEVVDFSKRLLLIDPDPGREVYGVAHVLAHLDLGHVKACGGGAFTKQQERDADWLARLRLDEQEQRESA